ncbi:15431_t:CDS:2, partial [Gigaspora rosea]
HSFEVNAFGVTLWSHYLGITRVTLLESCHCEFWCVAFSAFVYFGITLELLFCSLIIINFGVSLF